MMDTILAWIFIILFFSVIGNFERILKWIFSFFKASYVTVRGEGTLSQNLGDELWTMGPLECRGVRKWAGDDDAKFEVVEIQVRGLFPVRGSQEISFITSIFEESEKDYQAVVSSIQSFQEPHSTCFQFEQKMGVLQEGYGFKKWVRVGGIPIEILQPPRQGLQKIVAFTRMVYTNTPPRINNGFHNPDDKENILWSGNYKFDLDYAQPGWKDEAEGSRNAAIATVKLSIAIAMLDGDLHDAEGGVIREWISNKISNYQGSSRESWKAVLNQALREGFEMAQSGNLHISVLTSELMKVGSEANRYSCVDLLYEVIAADGVADSSELATINKIATALEIEPAELQRMSDQRLISVRAEIESDEHLESLLNIDSEWSNDQIKRHLREQFQKWNNRVTTLSDPSEKENAQRMLHLIAEARNKYK